MKVLLLALAIATPSPHPSRTPIPQWVLPVAYDVWCADHLAGAFVHLVSTPRGVYVVCRRRAYLFTREGIPPIEVTPFPGLTP